jgi:murein DD-endopeptidase MepM/ murein hydrolase activator NlpD
MLGPGLPLGLRARARAAERGGAAFPNGHDRLDIPASAGTPVRATAGGQVIFAGEEPRQFGSPVAVGHDGGRPSACGFLSRTGVREGDRQRGGMRLGGTWLRKDVELHSELRRDYRLVNRLPLSEQVR